MWLLDGMYVAPQVLNATLREIGRRMNLIENDDWSQVSVGHARIIYVGKSQSCMVYRTRSITGTFITGKTSAPPSRKGCCSSPAARPVLSTMEDY